MAISGIDAHRLVRGDYMAYRILYGPETKQCTASREISNKIRWLTAVFFLLLCISVRVFSPEGASMLRRCLLPGEPTATEQAFAQMIEDFQTGESLGDCLTAFCRSVVENEA